MDSGITAKNPQMLHEKIRLQPSLLQLFLQGLAGIFPAMRLQHTFLTVVSAGFAMPGNADKKKIQHNNKTAKNFINQMY